MKQEEVDAVTDRELAERAKNGDQGAFEQLVLNNQNKVFSLALRLTGDREDAADLAQEAFVKAWQNLAGFQGESSFSTWIYRLTANLCIDWLRKKKRWGAMTSLEDGAEPADWEGDPQIQLERSERSRALERGLARLPERQREILSLRELSGLSYQEIGEKLDLDLGTVKSRIARSRLALRKILLEDGNFFGYEPSKQAKNKGGGAGEL